jgi:hypothetical protein
MKIGILTFQRTHNYGAVLQAYALKTFLQHLTGQEVVIIDYVPKEEKDIYNLWSFNLMRRRHFKGNIKEFIILPFIMRNKYVRIKKFNSFINIYLKPEKINNEGYDLVIYGSDQIWRDHEFSPKGLHPVYFGSDYIKAKSKISYAASMGIIVDNFKNRELISDYLEHFNAISVRENLLAKFLRSLTKKHVQVVIDPVFLINCSHWSEMACGRLIDKPYLLYYALHEDDSNNKLAQLLASKLNLKLVVIKGYLSIHDKREWLTTSGPIEFLSLYKFSSFVYSSSFHGTAFAIIFRKQFYVNIKENSERITSLLSYANLERRFITNINTINLNDVIDYNNVYSQLEKHIHDSKMFLKKSLQ